MRKLKLLFDQNISQRVLARLPDAFADCQQVRTAGLTDAADLQIWRYAKTHGFAIVTFDADFYDLSLLNGHPPKIVWLRTGNLTTAELAACLAANGEKISAFIDEPEQACLEIEAIG